MKFFPTSLTLLVSCPIFSCDPSIRAVLSAYLKLDMDESENDISITDHKFSWYIIGKLYNLKDNLFKLDPRFSTKLNI